MKTTFTIKQVCMAAACALALGAMSTANAQNFGAPNDRELWVDTSQQVWMNGYGECWHSAYGPPPPPNVCNPAQPVAQAAPVVVAPRAAPVVVAAAAPQPVFERVTFDANVLFDFDKSALKPAGRDSLDAFISKTRDLTSPTAFAAVGYADRFGTDAYNQSLSERRVATVKDYLVSKGISASLVGTSGKGEGQPTTRPGECTGAKSTNTIACLQPDRHVFIEMSGSRLQK
jgi:OOP family OmpA-OmpF porin